MASDLMMPRNHTKSFGSALGVGTDPEIRLPKFAMASRKKFNRESLQSRSCYLRMSHGCLHPK